MNKPQADLRQFFVLSQDLMAIVDLQGHFVRVNPAWEHITGYSSDELEGESYFQFVHPEDREKTVLEPVNSEKNTLHFENRYRCKDGSFVWLSWRSTSRPDQGKIYAVARDITEQKRERRSERQSLEEQVRQAQRLESLGRLASGVAHDFNNILTVIGGHAQLMQMQLSEDAPLSDSLEEIVNAAQRASRITGQLLTFSKKRAQDPQSVNLNCYLRETLPMYKSIIGEDIDIELGLESNLHSTVVDPTALDQVVINLITNAREAMPTGGVLNISTANKELDEHYAAKHAEVQPGQYVMLAVSDTGQGMDVAIRKQIFDPFFTTKGTGTGLGLSTVYGVVRQNQGHIYVYSEPGTGTTFKIYFPQGEGVQPVTTEDRSVTVKQRGRVLIAEDEHAVRGYMKAMLEHYDYVVSEAANGTQALQRLDQCDQLEVLITDIVMPDMSGKELAQEVKTRHPNIKVLYVSGYAEDVWDRYAIDPQDATVLCKPFTATELISRLNQLMQ